MKATTHDICENIGKYTVEHLNITDEIKLYNQWAEEGKIILSYEDARDALRIIKGIHSAEEATLKEFENILKRRDSNGNIKRS